MLSCVMILHSQMQRSANGDCRRIFCVSCVRSCAAASSRASQSGRRSVATSTHAHSHSPTSDSAFEVRSLTVPHSTRSAFLLGGTHAHPQLPQLFLFAPILQDFFHYILGGFNTKLVSLILFPRKFACRKRKLKREE